MSLKIQKGSVLVKRLFALLLVLFLMVGCSKPVAVPTVAMPQSVQTANVTVVVGEKVDITYELSTISPAFNATVFCSKAGYEGVGVPVDSLVILDEYQRSSKKWSGTVSRTFTPGKYSCKAMVRDGVNMLYASSTTEFFIVP